MHAASKRKNTNLNDSLHLLGRGTLNTSSTVSNSLKGTRNNSKRSRQDSVSPPHSTSGRLWRNHRVLSIIAVVLMVLGGVLLVSSLFKNTLWPREEPAVTSSPHLSSQTKLNPRDEFITMSPFGKVTRRPPGQSVEELFAHYAPLTPHALTEIGDKLTLLNAFSAASVNASKLVMRALPNLIPPAQRRDYIMQKIHTLLRFGPRVAGSNSTGRQNVLDFIVHEAQWRPPREVLFRENSFSHDSVVTDPYWRIEWDNFTASTPLGERSFANVVFHFQGGASFRRRRGQEPKHRVKPRGSFAAVGTEGNSRNKTLEHVVLAAHWDSKLYTDFEFLGACDSVVPVVYLLETMRLISILTDTAAALRTRRSNEKDDLDNCELLTGVLSREYLALLRYAYADDEGFSRCLEGLSTNDSGALPHWRKVMQLVEHMPAISIIFFDGEEAFVHWEGTDHTYGSRHLAEVWRRQESLLAPHTNGISRFDSIDLFALYDLMGNAGSQFHNFFPDQSGRLFARLAALEHDKRLSAEKLYYPKQKLNLRRTTRIKNKQGPNPMHMKNTNTKENAHLSKDEESDAKLLRTEMTICLRHMPRLWCTYGPPHVMYTLHGVPRLSGSLQERDDLEKLWIQPNLRRLNTDSNIFFPKLEGLAQGKLLSEGFQVEDDNIHWNETECVLHLIPVPFPPSWHTVRDNGEELDAGTIHDLYEVLMDFAMLLGSEWIVP